MLYWRLASALALATAVAASGSSYADSDKKDDIDRSVVQQGFDASPIPKEKLNFKGKDPAMVGLGSYLVNAGADCNGCHTFPRFLRPAGTQPGTQPNTNTTGNVKGLGSNPLYGNPYLDVTDAHGNPLVQDTNTQLKANTNADTSQVIGHTPNGAPIYKYNHFLAGGRCFGFFMSRNLTPDNSGMPRGLTEAEFIQVMRQGKDISCDPNRPNPPRYGSDNAVDPICSLPEAPGAGVSFNPDVLQTMSWPTYHSLTDTDLKAIYAYLSALPQATACNTVDDGCPGGGSPGGFGLARTAGEVGTNRYRYANTDDCPSNYMGRFGPNKGDDLGPYGVAPPQ